MRILKITPVLMATLFFFSILGHSQGILTEFDSLAISKPKLMKSNYKFELSGFNEVTLEIRKVRSLKEPPSNFWGNLAMGTLTMLTGIETTSSDNALWVAENQLITNNPELNWRVPFFFPGEYIKSREKVKNEDGSTSVDAKEGINLDWSKGAYGLIIEKADTIGRYTMTTNLKTDTFCQKWLSDIERECAWLSTKLKRNSQGELNYNFLIYGVYKDKNFAIITSGNNYRSVLLFENKAEAIFQSEPNFMTFNKKDRINPYVLINKSINLEKRKDFLMLAMLNHLIALQIQADFYQM